MAIKYSVTTWTKLTPDGIVGAWLFILAPAVQFLSWLWFKPGLFQVIIVVVAGMAFLAGFVLLLIGRTTHSQVDG